MQRLKNELSNNIYGKKYSQLNEYEQDGINEELKGMRELMNEMFPKITLYNK